MLVNANEILNSEVIYTFPAIDVSMALVLGIPVIYLLFSIYVSFRSLERSFFLSAVLQYIFPLSSHRFLLTRNLYRR